MKIFGESTDPGSLGHRFRQKRMVFFKDLAARLPKPINILDVGGNQIFWINANFQNDPNYRITLLNLDKQKVSFPNIKSVVGDATDLSEFDSNQFDLVFSNSVIEHLFTFENQRKMAEEIIRVGRYHFVQTPNKHFIIEPHFLLPYFQYMPEKWQYSILTKTKLSRLKRWDKNFAKHYINEIRLITLSEMQELFPNSNIWKEKFLGITKSFVAHNMD